MANSDDQLDKWLMQVKGVIPPNQQLNAELITSSGPPPLAARAPSQIAGMIGDLGGEISHIEEVLLTLVTLLKPVLNMGHFQQAEKPEVASSQGNSPLAAELAGQVGRLRGLAQVIARIGESLEV